MALKAIVGANQMTNVDRLITLFRAYKDRNDEAFHRAAQMIIADELAANHHAYANALQKTLADQSIASSREKQVPKNLSTLFKDRRNGEQLVQFVKYDYDFTKLIFASETEKQISRITQEHFERRKLAQFGYKPKSKLLFWGPPGCGKTLTAHWLGYELGLPVGIVKFNALITSYLGETANHIQRVFDLAQSQPMVLLIDEVDTIGKNREDPNDIGELKRVVNSFLQAMDTFSSTQSILVAASNHQYLLDSALWRRFDDVIVFPKPNAEKIQLFVTKLLSGISFKGNIANLAKAFNGLSFSQVEQNLIETIKTMILENRNELSSQDITKQIQFYKKTIKAPMTKKQSKVAYDK